MSARETNRPLSVAEISMILAFRAFGAWPDDPAWDHFAGPWRARLNLGRDAVAGRIDAARALTRLKVDHATEAVPDPGRVHVTWWVRALRRETPSVRRAVAAFAPVPVGSALRRALGYVESGPSLTHPPNPEALAWALALAGERLVGGAPRRESDPPIVRAISSIDGRGHFRLFATLGLAKLAFAGKDGAGRPRDRSRVEALRPSLPTSRLELVDLALGDIAAVGPRRRGGLRTIAPLLGLSSVGRLLSAVEPQRARWTLQHLPYAIASLAGSQMSLVAPGLSPDDVLAWESGLLRASIVLLVREGRFEPSEFAEPGPQPGGRR